MNKNLLIVMIVIAALLLEAIVWIFVLRKKKKRFMSDLLKSRQEEETAVHWKKIRDAMLPAQLLKLFRKDDSEDFRLGEEKNIQAAVLSFNIPCFSEMIRSETSKDIFAFVNDVLSNVVPSVLLQGGEIDKFVNAGLSAFYLEAPERALRSAVSICEAMNQSAYEKLKFSMGLSYGNVMVGMVGHEKRFGVLTISETTGLGEFLQEMAGRYGIRILISGSMKKQIPDFEKHYNSRYLGCIFLKAADTTEDLYEVYDGDDTVDKNCKRRTRLVFEKGVELFKERRFYDARLHFIEVLKANRMDGMAKKYLHLCNQYQEKEAASDISVYLEVY